MNSYDSTSGVRPPGEKVDIDKLVSQYVLLRDRKRSMEAKHKEALEPFNQMLELLGNKLLGHLNETNSSSVATKHGTVYSTTKLSATIKDGAAFKDFVKSTSNFDLLDWKANAKAVFEFIEANKGVTPPGLNTSSFITVGVRRPIDKAED